MNLRQYRGLLAHYLTPLRGQVVTLGLLLGGGIGLQLINPQLLRAFIDQTQAGAAADRLIVAAILFLIVGLLARFMRLTTAYISARLGWQATNNLRADLARHCLGLDMAFHKQRTPGELIERIDSDVTTLANFFSQLIVVVGSNMLLIGGILLLIWREDWRIGAGLTVYSAITLAALGLVQNLAVRDWGRFRQHAADLLGFLEERLGGSEDIRASGAETHTMQRLDRLMDRLMLSNRSARLLGNVTFLTSNLMLYGGYALGLAGGAWLYTRGETSIGTAFMLVFYIGMLATPLENIRSQIQDLQRAGASIERIAELFAIKPAIREQVCARLPAGALEVCFEQVDFVYTDTTDQVAMTLDNLNFTLQAGQKMGLLGRTGSGKTTLTRLLFRLYEPTSGTIRLGGQRINDVGLADLRARVGMVTQEVQLFQASIRDNLTLFDRTIDDERIWAALAELGLKEWVAAMPAGLDTRLTGGGLSAGEAQLVAFTRVLLKDPGLIILDEASSRLDPATERLLEQAIDRLLRGRSAIIIAHRLATIQRTDSILILADGRIIEAGRRSALAADPESYFAGLLRTGMEELIA